MNNGNIFRDLIAPLLLAVAPALIVGVCIATISAPGKQECWHGRTVPDFLECSVDG